MGNFLDRKLFKNTNRYQVKIVRVAVVPMFLFCAALTYFLIELQHEQVQLTLYGTRMTTVYFINKWLMPVLIGVWLAFVFVLHRAFMISLELVGPFTRINRELDLVIRGESRHHIKVRDRDAMARELLERINILIDNLPPPNAPLKIH